MTNAVLYLLIFFIKKNSLIIASLIYFIFILWQEVPAKSKESPGSPWQFVGLLPLFDPPRHDSAETIRQALNLGVNVKMITGNNNIFLPYKCNMFSFFLQ